MCHGLHGFCWKGKAGVKDSTGTVWDESFPAADQVKQIFDAVTEVQLQKCGRCRWTRKLDGQAVQQG